jgi:GR25 family glycosyltransferase involved in LPS biosynthesis
MGESDLAPICLFAFNRPKELAKTIEALQKNYFAQQSQLFVFIDGPRTTLDLPMVQEVQSIVKGITGFKSIYIHSSEVNKGLASSIISGVNSVLENNDSVIVLEDDLVTSPNFLDFINQGLKFYKSDSRVFSVSGWSLNLAALKNWEEEFYAHRRMSSWGWGMWKDRWEKINWDKSYYAKFQQDKSVQRKFGEISPDMPQMLLNYLKGKNSSWAIRACYAQFELDMYTIAPSKTKVNNIGFGGNATHTKTRNRFDQPIDISDLRKFDFRADFPVSNRIIRQYRNKYSVISRVLSKVMNLVSR